MNRASNLRSLVLLLTVLFALFVAAQVGAQAQPAPTAPAMSTADFLATLSATPDGVMPSPVLDSGCTSNSQCPKGQLCCLACGFAGCETRACFVPMNGHCPLFP